MATHPLDRPVWAALGGGWAAYAEGDAEQALRLDPRYGPFAAAADASAASAAALGALIPDDGELWVVEAGDMPQIPDATVRRTMTCDQMIAAGATGELCAFETLGEDDAGEIHALVALTEPGPFGPLTHRIGDFIGLREHGRLVAIAGERMRASVFGEVSAVCTHPDHRGRGHASQLMRAVMQRIAARGETPFLHAYSHNRGAIGLYESLGFVFRTRVTVTVLARN